MELFPALLIGGPPHSGKSVLAYSLSQALRRLGLEHYLLRACPDGEGDWANEIDQSRVRLIRVKGRWSQAWTEAICRDIARRHLPLLVDAGGQPEAGPEPIFACCTHALLLAPTTAALAGWREYAHRSGLPVLAELESSLSGEAILWSERPLFRARLTGLERGSLQAGPVFEALVQKLSPYFNFPAGDLRRIHLNTAPVENALDLDRLARRLDIPFEGQKAVWPRQQLPDLLDYLPAGVALALYGRGPNWLYAAAALHSRPAAFYQFDPRLGWVAPPPLKPGPGRDFRPAAELSPARPGPADSAAVSRPEAGAGPQLTWEMSRQAGGASLNFSLPNSYLDYWQAGNLAIPGPPPGPLVLNGKLPHWLLAALALAYGDRPLLAVHQPQVGNVIVYSGLAGYGPGDLFTF